VVVLLSTKGPLDHFFRLVFFLLAFFLLFFLLVFFLFLAGVSLVDDLAARFLAPVLRAAPCFFEERVFLAAVPDFFFGGDFGFLGVTLPPLALASPPLRLLR